MNGRELVMLADVVAKEKGLNSNVVIEALEEGFATAIRRGYPQGVEISVEINAQANTIEAWRRYALREKIEDYETEITREAAMAAKGERDVIDNDAYFEHIEFNLTRQQFNITKQVALQKLKTEIKEQVLERLDERANDLLSGSVKMVKKDAMVVEVNALEVIVPRASLLSKDRYKINDKIYFVIDKINRSNHSTTIYGGRRSEKFIEALLKSEVPAVQDGAIEVKKISRIPGHSSKVVLMSHDAQTDPVRACVGPRGQYVKNMMQFLNNENVDFIRWDEDQAQYLINCMQPIQPLRLLIDADTQQVDVVVSDADVTWVQKNSYITHLNNLSDWNLQFHTSAQWDAKESADNLRVQNLFIQTLDVDEEIAKTLTDMGFANLEEVLYTPSAEFDAGLDADTINELKVRAKDYIDTNTDAYKMFSTGLSMEEVVQLAGKNVANVEDLSELDKFELQEMLPDIGEKKAFAVILAARE